MITIIGNFIITFFFISLAYRQGYTRGYSKGIIDLKESLLNKFDRNNANEVIDSSIEIRTKKFGLKFNK